MNISQGTAMRESSLLEELRRDRNEFVEESEQVVDKAQKILSAFVQSLSRSELDLDVQEGATSVLVEIGRLCFTAEIDNQLATILDSSNSESKQLYACIALSATDSRVAEDTPIELRRIFVNQHSGALDWAPHPWSDEEGTNVSELKPTVKPHLALLAGIILGLRYPIKTWLYMLDKDRERFSKWQIVPSSHAREYSSAQ